MDTVNAIESMVDIVPHINHFTRGILHLIKSITIIANANTVVSHLNMMLETAK